MLPYHNRLVGSRYVFSIAKSLFTERLKIALVFAILTIAPLISEYLLGNTPVNGNSPKVSGYLFVFLYLVLMFVVTDVNLLHTHISTYPKNDYWCDLSYQRTVRFAASVDVGLEDYNNCQQNNK